EVFQFAAAVALVGDDRDGARVGIETDEEASVRQEAHHHLLLFVADEQQRQVTAFVAGNFADLHGYSVSSAVWVRTTTPSSGSRSRAWLGATIAPRRSSTVSRRSPSCDCLRSMPRSG